MLNLMINVQLAVKCGSELSEFFSTDVGVPQGDGYSSNEFTFYFAKSLKNTKFKCAIMSEHAYAKPNPDRHIRINGEYDDDMNKVTTDPITVEYHKNNLPVKLRERNLHINETKTEEYAIRRSGDDYWKDCILLGSKLDTDRDIKRRTGLAIGVIHELRYIFYSKRLSVLNEGSCIRCIRIINISL